MGRESLFAEQVTDETLEIAGTDRTRMVHNSREGLQVCLEMMTIVWPSYSSIAAPDMPCESPWTSYVLTEARLLEILVQCAVHQDAGIRKAAAHILRTCMTEPQDGTGAFQPFFQSAALTLADGEPKLTSFKPISRARILNALAAFLSRTSKVDYTASSIGYSRSRCGSSDGG